MSIYNIKSIRTDKCVEPLKEKRRYHRKNVDRMSRRERRLRSMVIFYNSKCPDHMVLVQSYLCVYKLLRTVLLQASF